MAVGEPFESSHLNVEPDDICVNNNNEYTNDENHNDNNICDKMTYDSLDDITKETIINIIRDNKDILLRYKSSSYIYPNWLNIRKRTNCTSRYSDENNPHDYIIDDTDYFGNSDKTIDNNDYFNNDSNNGDCNKIDSKKIMMDIGYFVMTRVIDYPYLEIPKYRSSVNNPFHRALWHIANYTDFNQVTTTELENDSMQKKFFRFLDAFCLMSRVKTLDEFKTSFYRIYRNITSTSPNENNVKDPLWIYHKYSVKSIPNVYVKYPHLSELPLMSKLNTNDFFKLLCEEMELVPRRVQIKDIILTLNTNTNNTNQSGKTDSKNNNLNKSIIQTVNSINNNNNNENNTNNWTKINSNNNAKPKNNNTNYQKQYERHYGKNGYLVTNKMLKSKSNGVVISNTKSNADTSNNWRNR